MSTKKYPPFLHISLLLDFLEFSSENREKIAISTHFPLMIPYRLAAKMEKNNPECPIFLQFVPLKKELETRENFFSEPVADPLFQVGKKLLQKYEGRALVITTKACAMHCRYCFRQNFSYEVERKGFAEEITLLRNNLSLHEVILSGGDPLSLSNKALFALMDELAQISHIQIVRFHTRTPIGDPERIDNELIQFFATFNKKIVFVLHINHPKEIDGELKIALNPLRSIGVQLLCQSVLLKGVNDSVDTLKELSFTLFDAGILPYYIHQLDRFQGAAHFEVDPVRGFALIEELRTKIPGYLVPKYVQEIPHERSKTPITSASMSLALK